MSSGTVLVNASKISTFNKRKIMKNTIAKNSIKAVLFGSAIAMTTLASAALPTQWQLDDSHTRVGFSVNHLGFSTTMGHFNDVKGMVNYDIKTPNKANMNFTIATDSIDTNWDARDAHLKKDEFFNVAKYPTMTFKSTNITLCMTNLLRNKIHSRAAFRYRMLNLNPSIHFHEIEFLSVLVIKKLNRAH